MRHGLTVLIVLMAAANTAASQQGRLVEVSQCVAISSAVERLDCYDRAAKRGSNDAAGELSDSAATAALEAVWNRAGVGLLQGQVRFIGPLAQRQPESKNGEDAVSELPLYRAFARKGFITLSGERDLTKSSGDLNDFFQLSQGGVNAIATVGFTNRGKAAGVLVTQDTRQQLWLPLGISKVQTIVQNEALNGTTDRFRVIQGTHTFDVYPDLRQAYREARNDKLGRERRFKALLKFDPITRSWDYVGADIGARSGSYETDQLDRAVANIRRCGGIRC